ncbi:nitroreductase family deazaflavin-dependent oxidoreductase [Occultella glacieicola]|uniref:Nitroreductase family deazaflavin-dependent oxidoreductase n=1 Tax=Occultella glacieicola TaxID=2518684 RepID=A0ABY2E6G6_9MICO|nr:nitroreductase family deazaflavin-dependent oxidoreductase [Occultella glacieicola]TDE92492.1 nitroreductase family deazaflavin-dependent oxidoreductase [Occultella glacieicola]
MPLHGDYAPSPSDRSAAQVAAYESSGGTKGITLGGKPVVILTTVGARSGKLRKIPLMRVEHDGEYLAVGSYGGGPRNPVWVHNLLADPRVGLQDGPRTWDMVARELTGAERDVWWERAVAAFGTYASYQRRTERLIPVFLLTPASTPHA